MRVKSIVALVIAVLCLAVSSAWAEAVVNTGDIEESNFYGITTLNLLVGGVAVTFCAWILSKRKIL